MFSWLNFLSYAVVTAVTPGPNNLMSMSNAGRLGFRRAFPFNLGIWAGFSVVMLLCTFFCGALSDLIPRIKTPMLVVGAAYMLYLAYKTFKSPPVTEDGSQQVKGSFGSGFALQFALLLAFIGFVFTLCWSLFGSAFKLLFSKYARATNTIMALLLVYCAISLFL